MSGELREIARVSHFRIAEREVRSWFPMELTIQSRIDMHVVSQLSEHSYRELDQMTMRQYQPLVNALGSDTIPTPMRVEGTGPWELVVCPCCVECGLLCSCGVTCTCTDPGARYRIREFLSQDLHMVASSGILDPYRLVEVLSGGPVDELEYRVFRTLETAINRSFTSPFSPWVRSVSP